MGRKSKPKRNQPRPQAESKPKPDPRREDDAPAPRQRWTIPLGMVALAVAIGFWWNRETPQTLFHEAEQVFASDPSRSGQLLDQAIDKSGGDFPAAQVLRCRLMGRRGEWLEALGYFSTIQEPHRAPGTELLALGDEARATTNVVLARFSYRAAAEQIGEFRESALERLATLEHEFGNPATARDTAEELRDVNSDNPVASLVLGRLSRSQLDPVAAAEYYRQSLAHAANPALRRLARGELLRILLELGDSPAAREQWEQLEQEGAPTADERLLLAELLRLEGEPQQSVELIEGLPAATRISERALFLTGVAQLDLDEPRAASAALRKALQYNAFSKETHFKLATACQRLGDADGAETHFAKARELTDATVRILDLRGRLTDPAKQADIARALIGLYRQTGQTRQADLLEQAISTQKAPR